MTASRSPARSSDVLRTVCMALLLLGIVITGYAAFTFIQARNTIATADRIAAQFEGLDAGQSQALLTSIPPEVLIQQRQALQAQNQSLIVGGVGLVAIGLGWLGYDAINRRRKREA